MKLIWSNYSNNNPEHYEIINSPLALFIEDQAASIALTHEVILKVDNNDDDIRLWLKKDDGHHDIELVSQPAFTIDNFQQSKQERQVQAELLVDQFFKGVLRKYSKS
jgi:hypothetical protein